MGVNVHDFDAILADARAHWRCAVCGVDLERWRPPNLPPFCSTQHRLAFRDRRRYAEDPERERARSRAYYAANRDRIRQRSREREAAKRAASPAEGRFCSECGAELQAGARVVCPTNRCRDARFKRLNPEKYAAREAAKVERRRQARKAKRAAGVFPTGGQAAGAVQKMGGES